MIRTRGAEVGFTFGPREWVYNTFDAHRLLQWAGQQAPGQQLALKAALLRAYHGEGKDPSRHEVLVEAARSAGLDAAAARAVLASDAFADEVRAEEQQSQAMGITVRAVDHFRQPLPRHRRASARGVRAGHPANPCRARRGGLRLMRAGFRLTPLGTRLSRWQCDANATPSTLPTLSRSHLLTFTPVE